MQNCRYVIFITYYSTSRLENRTITV